MRKKKIRSVPAKGYFRVIKRNKDGSIKRVYFPPSREVRKRHKKILNSPELKNLNYSLKETIKPHLKNIYFVVMDIEDAFGSVTLSKVEDFGWDFIYKENMEFFFHINWGDESLIQGAPASPKIFELFLKSTIDLKLEEFCVKRGIVYSRYVDDFIFSSKKPIPKSLRKIFKMILTESGFKINPQKTQVLSTWNKPLKVLGVEIERGRVKVRDNLKKKLKHLRKNQGISLKKIQGMEAWVKYVDNINN